MSLTAGTKLGRYEIRSQLGAGGMGEVYRAFDPKINREVAIKVLPAAFSADRDRLARFEQEVQAAGALNHPNILSIYDVDTHDGSPYVVSELLDGETLHDRVKGVAIPSRKALDYALQVAKGLAAAHERGIVHRDLKPENIFITKDGRVKILDFGIAKLTESSSREAQTDVPTRKVKTDPGAVMGTVGYMSPEQVRGRAVDHRSDIFSFGAVLYEMLSGKRAFRGESAVDTLSAILKEDPPDLSTTNSNVAPALERIVRHCLEKNPEERFQSARDLAFDLETLSGISGAPVISASDIAIAPQRSKWGRWPIIALAAIVGAVVIGVGAFIAGKRASVTPQPSYHQLTFRLGIVSAARFAPDGQTIVYSAAWDGNDPQLFSARPDSPESRSLGLLDANLLAISSTGEMAIQLISADLSTKLARVPLAGGAPREVIENVDYADWSPDGADLAIVRTVGGKSRLEYPVGKGLYETTGSIDFPRVSRKGDMIAFLDHPAQGDSAGMVAVVDLAGKERTLSAKYTNTEGLAWSPDGTEVWFTGSKQAFNQSLHAVTLNGQERLIESVAGDILLDDIAADGHVLLIRWGFREGIILGSPSQTKERDLYWHDCSEVQDLSPDGKVLLFNEGCEAAGAEFQTYIRKTDGSPAVRLGPGFGSSLSPDGKWVISARYGSPAQLVLLPTGTGEPRPLTQDSINHLHFPAPPRWFPDGKRFFFNGNEPGHGIRAYAQNTEGGSPHPITPEGSIGYVVSPDGKSLVAVDSERKAFLYAVEGGEARSIPGFIVGEKPIQWSADGHSLYVAQFGRASIRVSLLDLASGRRQPWKEIAPQDATGLGGYPGLQLMAFGFSSLVLTPDAKSYAYYYSRDLSDLYLVEGLK